MQGVEWRTQERTWHWSWCWESRVATVTWGRFKGLVWSLLLWFISLILFAGIDWNLPVERGREYNDGVSDTGDCRGRAASLGKFMFRVIYFHLILPLILLTCWFHNISFRSGVELICQARKRLDGMRVCEYIAMPWVAFWIGTYSIIPGSYSLLPWVHLTAISLVVAARWHWNASNP